MSLVASTEYTSIQYNTNSCRRRGVETFPTALPSGPEASRGAGPCTAENVEYPNYLVKYTRGVSTYYMI